MKTIPLICHTFWAGPLPDMTAYGKLQDDNPSIEFWLWDEENISGLGLDYNDLLKRFVNAAGASNVVRLHALHANGGVWLDMDFVSHKPMDKLFEIGDWAAEQEPGRFCNAAMGARRGSPWITHQISTINKYEKLNAFGGVDNMNEAPRTGVTTIPTEWVYSYFWYTPIAERKAHPDAIVEHLWAGTWLPKHS